MILGAKYFEVSNNQPPRLTCVFVCRKEAPQTIHDIEIQAPSDGKHKKQLYNSTIMKNHSSPQHTKTILNAIHHAPTFEMRLNPGWLYLRDWIMLFDAPKALRKKLVQLSR